MQDIIIKIRHYKDSDFGDVKKNLQDGNLFDPAWDSREILRRKIKRNPGSVLVAVVDKKAVGSVYIVEDGWNAFIFRLAVRKEYRKLGIGRLLMNKAESRLRELGVKEVSLFFAEGNRQLKRYYMQRGYIPTKNYSFMYKVL